MGDMMLDSHTMPNILCCMCGIAIPSNPANMCVNCIRGQVDITDGIPKQLMIQFCRGCGRYLNPPNHWTHAELESKELLAMCIKRVKGLNKVKLVDAGFIWTEPHSKRLKVKLTVQKEVFVNTILQQVFVIEFVVQGQQCDVCARYEAKDTWMAVCQVRQRVEHKKTFFFLEQLIIKHGAHANTINIKERPDGLDFFYSHKSHAMKMIDFLQAVVPVRFNHSEKLVSHDDKSNTANYKYTFVVEIVPICNMDVVCLPRKVARAMGNITPLLLCYKISSLIHFVDPLTTQTVDMTNNSFWASPFRAICSSKQMIQYVVIDIVPIAKAQRGKFILSEVTVARATDFGHNDTMFTGRTHIGHILKPGDYALGYDIGTGNFNDDDTESIRADQMPDFILVKKTYPERRKKKNPRYWGVPRLNKEVAEDVKNADIEKAERDREEMMQEIEENPELRAQINLYKVKGGDEMYAEQKKQREDEMMDGDDDYPEVQLTELLEDLTLQ